MASGYIFTILDHGYPCNKEDEISVNPEVDDFCDFEDFDENVSIRHNFVNKFYNKYGD